LEAEAEKIKSLINKKLGVCAFRKHKNISI